MSDQTKPMLPGLPEPSAYRWTEAGVIRLSAVPPMHVPAGFGRLIDADQCRAIQLATWKAAMEHAAKTMEGRAEDVRKSNTYRGRVNQAAQFAADQLEFGAAAIRQAPEPGEGG